MNISTKRATSSNPEAGFAKRLSLPVLMWFAGCAVVPPQEVNERFQDVWSQRHDQYRLKEGDTLRIEVATKPEDPAFNQTNLLVLPDGRSDLYHLDTYKLAGKTITEFEQELKEKVATLVDVSTFDVRIQVIPAEEFVYMMGQFLKPDRVPLGVRMTLQEAVVAVGGMRITGDTDWALLARPFRDPIHPDLFRIDLNFVEEDIYLLPGDRVILGRNAAGTVIHYMQEFIYGLLPSAFLSTAIGVGAQ